MADGGNLSIDALQLQISASATSATDSLDSLATSLKTLKDRLTGLKTGADNVTKMANAFEKMSSFQNLDLSGLASQLERVSKIQLKPTGIVSFANSMKRFNDVSKSLDFSSLQQLHAQLSQLKDVSSNTTELLRAVSSFARSSEKMKEAANNFPALAMEIKEFFDQMSNVTISDNTAQMATALADIAKHGKGVGGAMEEISNGTNRANASITRGQTVMKLLGDTAKGTVSILKSLASTLLEISSTIGSGILNGVKSLITRFNELKTAAKGFHVLSENLRTMLSVFVGFYGIRSVFMWMRDAIITGADVAEVNHIVEATFGDLSDGVKEWATKTMDGYGIAENAAKRYAGTLGAVFQSSGVSMAESEEMSKRLVELAGDLSSFYNIDTETVYTKLKSGMAGMVRPLRDVGIDLSVASLSAFALEQGITKSWQSMSQAEKIALRYQYILQATSNIQGDFSRTSGSMANQLRTLRAYAASITQTIGDGLASALRHVIRYLNIAAKYVLRLASAFAGFMKTLFGANISGGGAGLIDSDSFDDVAEDLGDASDGAGGTADGLGDAAENAKKLEKALSVLPFDELNQLNKDAQTAGASGGSGGGGGIGGGGIGDFGDLGLLDQMKDAFDTSAIPDAINKWAERIKEAFKAHDWIGLGRELAWGINQGLQWLYNILDPKNIEEKVLPWVYNFATVMNSLVDNINWDLLGRTLGRGLNTLLMIANTWLTSFSWSLLGKKLAEGANGLVDEIRWDYLGQYFANKLNMFWQTAYNFVSNFDWKLLGESLAVAFDNFVATVDFDAIGGTISEGLNGITEAVNTFLNNFDAEGFGTKLGNSFKKMVSSVKAEQIGLALSGVWNKAWVILKNFIVMLGDKEGKGTGIGAKIHGVIESAIENIEVDDMTEAISTFVQKVAEDIAEVFGDTEMWGDLGYKIGDSVGKILSDGTTWLKIGEALNAVIGGLVNLFKNAVRGLLRHKEEIAKGIKTFLSELDWADIAQVVGVAAIIKFVTIIPGLGTWLLLSRALSGKLKTVITESITTAMGSAEVTAAASGSGTAAATAAGTSLLETASAWAGPLGVLGVALIGATVGNTPEARAEIQRSKEALDKDIEEMSNGVENAFQGTGYTLETLAGITAENAIKMTEEAKQQMSISLTAMQRKGVITKEELGKINGAIYSGNQEVIGIVQEMETAWKEGDTARVQSSANAAMQIVNSLGSEQTSISNIQTVASTARTFLEGLGIATENTATKANDAVEKNELLADKFGKVGEKARDAKTDQDNYNAAVNSTPSLWDTIKNLAAGFLASLLGSFGTKKDYAKKGKNMPEGVGEGIDEGTESALTAITTMSQAIIDTFTSDNEINSPSEVYSRLSENIPEGVAQGIENTSDQAISEINTLGNSMTNTFDNIINSLRGRLQSSGSDMIRSGLINGVTSALRSFNPAGEIDGTFSSVWNTLSNISSEMYNAGQSISQSLSEGISSVHISLPHINTSWDTIYYGDGSWVQIPYFYVDWYARGGLFTNPTIAGFGEAGDEAALPLENRRAMSRIANAIVDNADGGLGMNEDKMASAVARGYVQAMMMNQGNVQPPIFHITVKTEDNEVLARAVQRGYQSMDYRNNATPSFGY